MKVESCKLQVRITLKGYKDKVNYLAYSEKMPASLLCVIVAPRSKRTVALIIEARHRFIQLNANVFGNNFVMVGTTYFHAIYY